MSRVIMAIALAGAVGCNDAHLETDAGSLPAPVPDAGSDLEPPAENPPPPWGAPISGGTMLVTRDGRYAVVADPDRDRVVTVELARGAVVADIALVAGDEPGRLVEDAAGRIHVALRRGGALVTLPTPTSRAGMARRRACGEPRGVAYDAATDQLHVACTSGELVSFAADGGEATRRLQLDRDLRDVVVSGTQLLVTRFRSAEVLTLDASGSVVARVVPPTVKRLPFDTGVGGSAVQVDAVPAVAWRAVAASGGRTVLVHQRQNRGFLTARPGGYGGFCLGRGAVESAVTVLQPGVAPFATQSFVTGSLPVDIAISPGGLVAAASAGDESVRVAGEHVLAMPDDPSCPSEIASSYGDQLGAPTSVAFDGDRAVLAFYPEAPAISVRALPIDYMIVPTIIPLPGGLGYDAGRNLFHKATVSSLACASCHPEGREDGLVWSFKDVGPRRTLSLGGGITRRAPYHWSGDLPTLDALLDEVFVSRMAGVLKRSARLSLGPWLDRLPVPVPAPVRDAEAVARGKQRFESSDAGCASCHAGALLTNNQLVDVGTGGRFKVPSLRGVGARAPYMHDGCAATLADRFGPCGGGDRHGHTSALTEAQRAELIAYLESL
jgi:hypothetical protein